MYATRIVQAGPYYFVEYKWAGSKWRWLLGEPWYWSRYSMVPDKTLDDAKNTQRESLQSHRLNYSWNTKVVEQEKK